MGLMPDVFSGKPVTTADGLHVDQLAEQEKPAAGGEAEAGQDGAAVQMTPLELYEKLKKEAGER